MLVYQRVYVDYIPRYVTGYVTVGSIYQYPLASSSFLNVSCFHIVTVAIFEGDTGWFRAVIRKN